MRPGLLRPGRAPRRHGPRRHPRVAVLPVASRASAVSSSGRRRTRSSRSLCLQAYNDWMIDEWCGAAPGRYIPLIAHPALGPGSSRPTEIERCAAKGATAFAFSENPEPLGLPTIHDPNRYWDPVMAAAQDLEMVVCMHVGSSSTMPTISSDAPGSPTSPSARSAPRARCSPGCSAAASSACPDLKIALSEGEHRLDARTSSSAPSRSSTSSGTGRRTSTSRSTSNEVATDAGDGRPRPPRRPRTRSATTSTAASSRSRSGSAVPRHHRRGQRDVSRPTTRTPTPRGPTASSVGEEARSPHLPEETQYKILRGNAERLYRFTPAEPPVLGECLTRSARRRSWSIASCAWAAGCASSTRRTPSRTTTRPRRSSSTPPGDPIEAIRNAVEACPTSALRLVIRRREES